jgi:hypothetical protein
VENKPLEQNFRGFFMPGTNARLRIAFEWNHAGNCPNFPVMALSIAGCVSTWLSIHLGNGAFCHRRVIQLVIAMRGRRKNS